MTTQPKQTTLFAVLACLLAFTGMSMDMYLPAMPQMARVLHAPDALLQLTVSGFLVGFCIGQLFWGPISDRYGRRGPIMIGLLLFLLGSLGCAASTNIRMLLASRILQALGGCASVTLGRAIVRDLYEGERSAQVLSHLMSIIAMAPLLGPLAGAGLLHLFGWRAIFLALAIFSVITLVGFLGIPESHPPAKRNQAPLHHAIAGYGQLFRESRMMLFTMAGGFFYGGLFAYVAGSPFAYISYYHISPNLYAVIFAMGGAGIFLSNTVNARLVTRVGYEAMLRLGAFGTFLFGTLLLVNTLTHIGGIFGLGISLWGFCSMAGFIIANSLAGALSQARGRVGLVAALSGCLHYSSGIASSLLLSAFEDGTPKALGIVIAVCGAGALACVSALRPRGMQASHKSETKLPTTINS